MIAGIGVDLCSVERLQESIQRTPQLIERLFHESERSLKPESLAARFALKEALAKAIGNPKVLTWNEISLSKDVHGKPSIQLHGTTKANFEKLGLTATHLSISHDAGVAIAMIVLES
ncbi:MAG: hypothetical protein RLZZ122_66 [Actinomycetota bacterium]|jgi:holo-[acyl-carrier protein] synthase